MKTRLAAIALAAALGALAVAPGCTTEDRASVQAQQICYPSKDCTFKDTCDAVLIGVPAVDTAVDTAGTLVLFIQVANQLANNASLDTGRTNTNDAHIDETWVQYEGVVTGEQRLGSNYRVPAEGSTVVSVTFTLGAAAAGEVVAHVRFRGYYDNGARFESGDFPITIETCSGCIGNITCPDSAPFCPGIDGMGPTQCMQ